MELESGSVLAIPVRLTMDPEDLDGPNSEVSFIITATDDPSLTTDQESRFLAPRDL